jgi:inosine-uridine nucleoside N-ribohydrolase
LCDYGLDDAIATLYLLEYADRFQKIDIVPISGNFPIEETFVNAKRLLTNYERKLNNVRIVDAFSAPQKGDRIPEIHGNDGMGDVLPPEYEENVPVINYDEWLEEIDESYTILSVGPCTVTIDILSKKGALPLILMAGNIAEPPNYNGYEFNHGVDTQAFAECVKYPHAVATLDTCHVPACDLNKFDFHADGLFGRMVDRYLELSKSRNEAVCGVYDLVAFVYLIHPERFEIYSATDKDGNKLSVLKYICDKPII